MKKHRSDRIIQVDVDQFPVNTAVQCNGMPFANSITPLGASPPADSLYICSCGYPIRNIPNDAVAKNHAAILWLILLRTDSRDSSSMPERRAEYQRVHQLRRRHAGHRSSLVVGSTCPAVAADT